jgi:hypothetical protein
MGEAEGLLRSRQGFVAPDDNTDARVLSVRSAGISGQPVG